MSALSVLFYTTTACAGASVGYCKWQRNEGRCAKPQFSVPAIATGSTAVISMAKEVIEIGPPRIVTRFVAGHTLSSILVNATMFAIGHEMGALARDLR